jgi:citrate lyase beta subunit
VDRHRSHAAEGYRKHQHDDIALCRSPGFAGIVLPKAERAEDIALVEQANAVLSIFPLIETPRRMEQVRIDTLRGRPLGFGGKLCIHPKQVDRVNACFLPGAETLPGPGVCWRRRRHRRGPPWRWTAR